MCGMRCFNYVYELIVVLFEYDRSVPGSENIESSFVGFRFSLSLCLLRFFYALAECDSDS